MIEKTIFLAAISAITDQLAADQRIAENLSAICGELVFYDTDHALPGLVNLLRQITKDDGDWIEYWLYELEQGTKFKLGMVTDNGKKVRLKTAEDLYRFLRKNFQGAKP